MNNGGCEQGCLEAMHYTGQTTTSLKEQKQLPLFLWPREIPFSFVNIWYLAPDRK